MARFLITGGAGFIGSNIAEHLVGQGETVRVLDNLSTGKLENLATFQDQIDFIEGSITDPDICESACKDVDFVLHQAAIPSVPRSVENPIESHHANVTGMLNVLEAARMQKCKRFVFAASSSAYGDGMGLPKVESMLPDPMSPYAVNKLCGEYYCRAFSACYGMETVCLRYFNVFGPRQDPTSQYGAVIPRFIDAVLNNRQPVIYGDGKQTRDFTFVHNAVEANIIAATKDGVPTRGEVFNIACGQEISLLSLLKEICAITGNHVEPLFEEARSGDVRHSRADVTAARGHLGVEPSVDLREGLQRTIGWFQGK